MQAKIKDMTRKMMALVSELSMNQVIFLFLSCRWNFYFE